MNDDLQRELSDEEIEEVLTEEKTVPPIEETAEPVPQTEWTEPAVVAPRNKNGMYIAIAALVILALIGVGFATGTFGSLGLFGGSDADRVAQGVSSLTEFGDNQPIENLLGNKQLMESMQNNSAIKGYLEVVDLPILTQTAGMALPSGITLSFDMNTDASRNSATSFGLGFKGTDAFKLHLYQKDKQLALAIPQLFKEVITADLSGDIKAKIENAPLLKGMVSQDQINQLPAVIEQLGSPVNPQKVFKEIKDSPKLKQIMADYKKAWVIKKAEDKKQLFNGKEQSFDGFLVTLPKAANVKFLRDLKDYIHTDEAFRTLYMDNLIKTTVLASAPQKTMTTEEAYAQSAKSMEEAIAKYENSGVPDPTFTIHLTDDNKAVSLVSSYTVNDVSTDVNIMRSGGDFLAQNASYALRTTESGKQISFQLTTTGKTEGDVQTANFTADIKGPATTQPIRIVGDSSTNVKDGTFEMRASLNPELQGANLLITGAYTDIQKGKAYTMVLDKINLSAQGQSLATLSGRFTLTDAPVFNEPSGEKLDLFTATQADVQNLQNQVMQNIQTLMQFFGGMFGPQ